MPTEAPMVKPPRPFMPPLPPRGADRDDEDRSEAAPYDATATMEAWERLLTADERASRGGLVRGVIERSWQRSVHSGVDARGRGSELIASIDEVDRLRRQNTDLLDATRRTFGRIAEVLGDTATMVVITDSQGVVIETSGDPRTIDAGHDIHLQIGANWGETVTGTNGIGTALITGQPVYVRAAEHFCEGVKAWTCIGTPIFSPLDNRVVGVIDFSGPQDIYHRHNVALGMMAASHIELALADKMRFERVRLLEASLSHLGHAVRGDGFVLLDRFGRIIHHCDVAAARWRSFNPEADLRIGDRLLDLDGERWHGGLEQAALSGALTERLEPLMLDGSFSGAMLILPPPARQAPLRRPSVQSSARRAVDEARAAIVGTSDVLMAAIERAERAAMGKAAILLEGETGAGKELFARLIHACGQDTGKEPFVTFNCGAVSKELLGGELFGHAPGAFTGATREGRAGRFEVANGGVLSLDEIGEMPLELQPYLLRVLEERAVYRIGDSRPRPVDVRLVASTNRDLKLEAAEGRFRKDLYFRISGVKITIPPLRERRGDIPLLIDHFNALAAETYSAEPLRFRPEVLDLLETYAWPGNVRELRNIVESLFLMSTSRLVGFDDFPEDFVADLYGSEPAQPPSLGTGRSADEEIARIDATERRLIERTLAASGGNTSLAAERLGISRSTLYRKLHQYRSDG